MIAASPWPTSRNVTENEDPVGTMLMGWKTASLGTDSSEEELLEDEAAAKGDSPEELDIDDTGNLLALPVPTPNMMATRTKAAAAAMIFAFDKTGPYADLYSGSVIP
jgi:hypothetical protein